MKTIFFAMIGMAVIKGDDLVDPDLLQHASGGYEEQWKIARLENLSGEDALRLFDLMRKSDPSPSFINQGYYHLSRNSGIPEALREHFSETPVLYENSWNKREPYFKILSNVKAEWAIHLLLELMEDTRPLTTAIDVDLLRESRGGSSVLMARAMPNDALAMQTLYEMLLKVNAIEEHEWWEQARGKLTDPAFQKQIPDILLTAWGEKAVMNSDIGLGPNNRPLAKRPAGDSVHPGSSRRPPPRGMAGVMDAPAPAPGRAFPWLPLGGSLLVLAAAAAMAAKRRSGTSAPGPPRRPG